jgi:hypothetical protein
MSVANMKEFRMAMRDRVKIPVAEARNLPAKDFYGLLR